MTKVLFERELVQCTKCGTFKSRYFFYQDKRRRYGLRSECKECTKNRYWNHLQQKSKQGEK